MPFFELVLNLCLLNSNENWNLGFEFEVVDKVGLVHNYSYRDNWDANVVVDNILVEMNENCYHHSNN